MQGNQTYAPGPPAYNWDAPPTYQPPEGGSKVMPNQNVVHVGTTEYGAEGSTAPLASPAATHAPEVRQ